MEEGVFIELELALVINGPTRCTMKEEEGLLFATVIEKTLSAGLAILLTKVSLSLFTKPKLILITLA